MISNWVELGDSIAPDYIFQGSAHSISGDPPDKDIVAELRKACAEVSGKPIKEPPKNKMGFY